MRTIRFFYDVVCPYSYLESHAVEAAEDAGELEAEWLPFELRPAPRPLLEPRGDHLRVDWTRQVYRRSLELGIEIHLPRYQPRSTLPLAACLWAGEQGRLRDFKHALYEAFFCEGEDIATDREIAAAEQAGLDPDGAVEARLLARADRRIPPSAAEAAENGIMRVPVAADRRRRVTLGHGRPGTTACRRGARPPRGLAGRGVQPALPQQHVRGEPAGELGEALGADLVEPAPAGGAGRHEAGLAQNEMSISRLATRPQMNTYPAKEEPMKYLMQIYQGEALEAQASLSEAEQQRVWADYAAIRETPGVTSGEGLALPETATTVRVQDGRTLTTDGPFAETKEALGGYFLFEAEDLRRRDRARRTGARGPLGRRGRGAPGGDVLIEQVFRAELLRRLDRRAEARESYLRALELVRSDAERRFLQRRLAEVEAPELERTD